MCDGPRPERRLRVPIEDVPLHAGGAHRRERQAHATSEAAGAGKAEEGADVGGECGEEWLGLRRQQVKKRARHRCRRRRSRSRSRGRRRRGGALQCLLSEVRSRLTDAEGLMRGCGLGMRSAAARGGGRGRKAGGGGGVGERPCGGASIRGTLIAVSVQKLCRQLTRASHA